MDIFHARKPSPLESLAPDRTLLCHALRPRDGVVGCGVWCLGVCLGLSSPHPGVFVPVGLPCGAGTLRPSRLLTKRLERLSGRTLNPVTGTFRPSSRPRRVTLRGKDSAGGDVGDDLSSSVHFDPFVVLHTVSFLSIESHFHFVPCCLPDVLPCTPQEGQRVIVMCLGVPTSLRYKTPPLPSWIERVYNFCRTRRIRQN